MAVFLGGDEIDRLSVIRHASVRRQFILAHGLLRLVLSRAAGVAPEDILIRSERNRRPRVLQPASMRTFGVSLSHTAGMVAVGYHNGKDIGVDIEEVDPEVENTRLPRSVLSPREYGRWKALPGPRRPAEFFRIWTVKEALLKAAGVGLLVDPSAIDTGGDDRFRPRLLTLPQRFGPPGCWTLRTVQFGRYCCSVAVAEPDHGQHLPVCRTDPTAWPERSHRS